jgi:aspartokinase
VYLQFDAPFGADKGVLESKVYQLMADYRINLFMLNVHPNNFGFAVPRKQLPNVKEILDGLVIPLLDGSPRTYIVQVGRAGSTEVAAQERMLSGNTAFGEIRKCAAKLTENCTMVSVIAHDYLNQPGIYEKVMHCLQKASIHVLQSTDSPLSVSLLVSETDCERAVSTLHDEFELADAI